MSLRDKLLAALADLPGTRTFHVHVLTSAPRKHSGLFPYAHPRPRTYLQEVLILLSEQTSSEAPRVLVTAIEASVYNIPSTSSGILYVSKVDSSGHASAPSPTATLVRAFLAYYADPVTRPISVQHLWIQLFARAQNQYLFPNSSEYEGKRPLSDVKLCAWWKKVYSEVAGTVNTGLKGVGKVKLFYILPGYSELEAAHALSRGVTASDPSVQWAYGHPYSQTDIPLPCPKNHDPNAPHNLGHFIPWFDDDPKSRFIDEIAYIKATEGGIRSPKRKRAPSSTGGDKRPPRRDEADDKDKEKEKEKEERPQGELAQVTADEFWERMSFRQECVAGAVTGFFTMCVSTPPPVDHDKTSEPPGQVSSKMVRRIVSSLMNHHEFSTRERAVRATEMLEGVIKGLCDDAPAIPSSAPPSTAAAPRSSSSPDTERPRTPEPDRPATLDVPRTPPPKRSHLHTGPAGKAGGLPEISPNPFPDPVPSPETYTEHIYGRIDVRNAPLPPHGGASGTEGSSQGAAASAPVTVLAVRKKRKPAPP
ncbi:histone acetylation protein-domain-containing protein [Cerioporus squamosus]|nr:histone acetylation protein-domain-containing protein [Cerioporus squamosus]